MKLSDIMSNAGLAIYAEVGLLIFLAVFIGVVVRVMFSGKDEEYERAGLIPLREDPVTLRTSAKRAWEEKQ